MWAWGEWGEWGACESETDAGVGKYCEVYEDEGGCGAAYDAWCGEPWLWYAAAAADEDECCRSAPCAECDAYPATAPGALPP